MNNAILLIISLLFYGIVTIWQSLCFIQQKALRLPWLWFFGFIAVITHGILLYHWIDLHPGQNLSFYNLLSLVTWLIAVLILLATFTQPVANLTIFIFPLAILSIFLEYLFPHFSIVQTNQNPKQLIHILLSTVTFSLLCIAGIQAIFLAIQENLLKHKQAAGVIQVLPPLQVMEKLLFQILILGFVGLTLVLLTSLFSFYPFNTPNLWQKVILASFAWLVFAILLVGRWHFGWRGLQAARWTLTGVFMVMLTYFGSKVIAIY